MILADLIILNIKY